MATLYRKYRPQNFSEVVGQNHIKITLEQEIKTGKNAQAYLFCGPRAVGKTTMARVLAKALNCQKRKSGESEPCNQCQSCQEITQARALDIIEIDAASHTGVDHVREHIIANARVTPTRAKYKVFIIDEVHMLSISAFNALLKVLEEPPAHVVFILCTTEVHKVPTTIISRCQRFDFKRISFNDIVKKLNYIVRAEKIKIDKKILEAIARQSAGHMRDAESILGQIVVIGGKEITQEEADLVIPRSDLDEVLNLINFLVKKDAASAIRLINHLIDEGIDLKVFIANTIEILRKIMLTKISPSLVDKLGLELGEAIELKIAQLSQELTVEQAVIILERFIKVANELKGETIEQLPIELAIAEHCISAPAVSKINPKIQETVIVTPKLNQSVNLTLGQLLEKWHEVLAKVKQFNHSLSFILRVCQPRELIGNKIILTFKYKFHKERVSQASVKALIEKILVQVYGLPLSIEAVIDENLEVPSNKLVSEELATEQKEKKSEQEKIINDLLKTFGGKIVK